MNNRRYIMKAFLVAYNALLTNDAFSGLIKKGSGTPQAMRVSATARGESDITQEDGSFTDHVGGPPTSPGDTDLIPFVHERQISYVVNAVYADSVIRRNLVRNYASVRQYTGQAEILQVLPVTTDAVTGGVGIFARDDSDSTSEDDGGVVLVAKNGTRWKRRFDGPVSPKWWGAVGDGKHDDAAPLQAALNYVANHALSLEIESGDFRCGAPLVLGSGEQTGKQRSFRIAGQGQVATVGKGTRILYDGPPATAILSFGKNADRHILLEGFQVECAQPNLTEFGILFSDTTFSEHYLRRVSVLHARTGFGVLRGSGANGEFLSFENCIAAYVERFFFQDPLAGQAFEPVFVNCHANLTYDAPVAVFELGGSQGGFGLTVINQSCSFVGEDPGFALRHVSAYLKLAGTSDNITVIGGRAEGLSTMLLQTDAAGSTASVTFGGVTMSGMSTCNERPVINSARVRSANGVTFSAEKCTFQLDIASGRGDFAMTMGTYDGSSYLFDRCNFRMRGKFSFVGGNARNGSVEYQRCALDRVSASNSIVASARFDKSVPEFAKRELIMAGSGGQVDRTSIDLPAGNLLSRPLFGNDSGRDIAAPFPWVHLGKSKYFVLLASARYPGIGGEVDIITRIFTLGAESGVSQVVGSERASLSSSVRYEGIFSVDGPVDSIVKFTLVNPESGAIHDERIVTPIPVLPLYVSLFALTSGTSVAFEIYNKSGGNVTIRVLRQYIYADSDDVVAEWLSGKQVSQ